MFEYVRRVWSAYFVNRLLLFLLINFVNLFHPQFISQFGLSDFPYLSFVAIHFVTACKSKMGQVKVSRGVSVISWLAAPVANVL